MYIPLPENRVLRMPEGDSMTDGRNLEREDTHEAQTKHTLGTFRPDLKPWSYQSALMTCLNEAKLEPRHKEP